MQIYNHMPVAAYHELTLNGCPSVWEIPDALNVRTWKGRCTDVAPEPDVRIMKLGRKKTSGKLSYGPRVGRHLNVTPECDAL